MRTFFSSFFILLCIPFYIQAQDSADLSFSGSRVQKKTELRSIMPLPDGRTLLLRAEEGHLIKKTLASPNLCIDLLDENLNLRKKLKTNLLLRRGFPPSSKVFRFAKILNERVYIFYTIQRNKKTFNLYAVELDQENLTLLPNPQLIGDFEKMDDIDFGRADLSISTNKEHILIYFREIVSMNKNTHHICMLLMDKDLNPKWQYSILKPTDKDWSNYMDVAVSNIGEVFLLEQRMENGYRNQLSHYVGFEYYLHKFDAYGEKEHSVEISLEDKQIKDLDLSFNFNEELLALGFYSDKVFDNRSAGGTVYFRYDPEYLEVVESKMDPFKFDFMVQGDSELKIRRASNRSARGKLTELNISLRHVVYRSDGGVLLIGENHEVTYALNEMGQPYYTHTLNDIVIFNIDAKGDISWSRKIPKRQSLELPFVNPIGLYGELEYSSFTYSLTKDRIDILFNDNSENMYLEEERRFIRETPENLRANFCRVSIDQDGEMEKEVLFVSRDKGVVLHPAFSRSCNDSRTALYFYGRFRNKERLARYSPES